MNLSYSAVNYYTFKNIILCLIDEYINGKITKEQFAVLAEVFIESHEWPDDSKDIINLIISELAENCHLNVDEPGNEESKEQDFWKQLKQTEKRLRNNTLTKTMEEK